MPQHKTVIVEIAVESATIRDAAAHVAAQLGREDHDIARDRQEAEEAHGVEVVRRDGLPERRTGR